MLLHTITIFLGSFLLFQLQPLVGRSILPWFGGGPAVWATCMVFFQAGLLAGYSYAHGVSTLNRTRQACVHGGLLIASLILLPLSPAAEVWKPVPGSPPAPTILSLLATTVGVPYLALCASAPLVQHWFLQDFPQRSPYRLYSFSNIASLLALASYPFVVEPLLSLRHQALVWSWGFGLYCLACAACVLRPVLFGTPRTATAQEDPPQERRGDAAGPAISGGDLLFWLLLSACGSALLLATTNQLCQEVAVIPFLWIAPLALYLLSFVICFRNDQSYDRVLWGILLPGFLVPACSVFVLGARVSLPLQIIVYLAALFAGCMVCHGELVRSRPHPTRLTAFYLALSAGGALGGMFVALAAPALFTNFWEYPVAWWATCLTVVAVWHRSGLFRRAPNWLLPLAGCGIALLVITTARPLLSYMPYTDMVARNFYGVLRVIRHQESSGEMRTLMHGAITHGIQFVEPGRRRRATSYYGPESGIGLALLHHPRRISHLPLRVGVIGLGTGSIAVYGLQGDLFRFYEINPAVIAIARERFSYLADSAARIETATGDARLTLETELASGRQQRFDIMVVDAFSSDAIPIHLLTRECFAVYGRHLRPDGIIAINATNRFLDLAPLIRTEGELEGFRVAPVSSPADSPNGIFKADWILLTRNTIFINDTTLRNRLAPLPPAAARLWTDDYASLWPLVKF
ncbi:hypothetical protein FO488_10385 [Geobacter sp. FeAm09]|uniref:fused MFS/spermidine synthase n=1 Tax=Geobacter sp. FeAm09 TaxID=2597769 RepID=UPI0011EDC74A|nr:fused MFS/spermidine synthase [Geobacter sp. FeAm09]QEM68535.1 hypothetical protein FO488_10385 [Geobacter sp. FeAm09]